MSRSQVVRVGVGVFVFKNGGFLMGRRSSARGKGLWSIPGGHLEVGESLEMAATREVFEETGVWIKNLRFGTVTNDIFLKEQGHYITIWMMSEWRTGDPTKQESDSFTDLGWYTFDALPEPLFDPWHNLMKSDEFEAIKKMSE